MKSTIYLFVIACAIFLSTESKAQSDDTKDANFKIEIEPISFALRGFGLSGIYALTKDNNLSAGIHVSTLDVPTGWTRKNMFDNVSVDSGTVRLGFHGALMLRYKFNLFKQYESNPYVGLIAGYEYFDVISPAYVDKVRLSTFVLTPYLGFEFYIFKQIIFVNPQIRSVVYVGSKTSNSLRPESMGSFFFWPQVSIGARF